MLNRTTGNYADLDYSGRYKYDDGSGTFEVFSETDGWYYWHCSPAVCPDVLPIGPFATSADAYHDAQGF